MFSKKKTNYLAELEAWTNANVIVPMTKAVQSEDEDVYHETAKAVEKSIAGKARESFLNGLKGNKK